MNNKNEKLMKTDIRQEQIIDSAIKIIHKNGYSALSIRELAKQVQISEGAIYKHFSGKEEIISGISKRILVFTNELFEELDLAISVEDKLQRFIYFHLELFEKKPELVSIMFSEELSELKSDVTHSVIELMKKRHTILRNILNQGIAEGSFRHYDSEILSTMIQGFIKLTISKWKQSGYKFSLSQQGQKFYNTLEQILIVESKQLNKNKTIKKEVTMSPIEILKHEHEIILHALKGVEKIAEKIRETNNVDFELIQKIIDFSKNFTDGCHHSKEEKKLFPKLVQKGFGLEYGPIAVMLSEHDEGRKFITRISADLELFKNGDVSITSRLADTLEEYIELLTNHIEKENNVLFEMALEVLTNEEQQELSMAFDKIESEEIGEGVHEYFHQLAHELADYK